MFEAARPESGGHWERGGQGWRLGRGGQGTGTDRGGGLLKRCSFYPSPMPSAPSSLHSAAGQLGVPQALGHLNMAPHPLPLTGWFPWGSEPGRRLSVPVWLDPWNVNFRSACRTLRRKQTEECTKNENQGDQRTPNPIRQEQSCVAGEAIEPRCSNP